MSEQQITIDRDDLGTVLRALNAAYYHSLSIDVQQHYQALEKVRVVESPMTKLFRTAMDVVVPHLEEEETPDAGVP